MDAQLSPDRYLLGDDLSVLDLYVATVSRFGPWHPRLRSLWKERFTDD
jgi:GST-like protein